MTHDFECPDCEGYGGRLMPFVLDDAAVCPACQGTGWISCDRGGVACPFDVCACEKAWERQQEDNASEPPITMAEQYQRAAEEKQRLS